MEKICCLCLIKKDINEFGSYDTKYGKYYRKKCKNCKSKENKDWLIKNNYSKDYYNKNKLRYEKYYKDNKDKIKEYNNEYYKINGYNKDVKSEYIKNKKINDKLYVCKSSYRRIIYNCFRSKGVRKKSKSQDILGCTFEEFKLYIESKFESWMTWENYGKYNGELNYGWDIDHIIPLSSAKTEEDVIRLNHYTNLQPLCGYTNRYIKSDIF